MKSYFRHFQLFTFYFLLLTFISCQDQMPDDPNKPPELPPLTMEGKNTLGCKINGKNWVASVGFNLSGDQAFRMGYDSVSGHFGINSWWIDKSKGIDQKVGFVALISKQVIGNYLLAYDITSPDYVSYNNGRIPYWLDVNQRNELNIVYYNKAEKIISGTFELIVINESKTDTLVITEGRFDGRY